MNKYRDIVGRINYGLFLAVVFLLPFPQICLRYACVAWFISWIMELRWLQKPAITLQLSTIKTILPFILFGLWYVWKGISFFWCTDTDAWSWHMERFLTFWLIVPIGIWGVNEHYNWRNVGLTLIIGCISAVVFYLILMTILHVHPSWAAQLGMPAEWTYYDSWRMFFKENISFVKHRLFLSSVEILGAITAWRLFRKQWKILLPTLAIMLSIIVLSDSRQAMISAIVLAIMEFIFALPEKHKIRRSIAIILTGIVLLGSIFAIHPRMKDFNYGAFTEIRKVDYNHDVRLLLWSFALQQPRDYMAYGLGAGQSTPYLTEKYRTFGYDYFADAQLDSHNQYLTEMMELGIPGLLFFLLAWLSIPLCAPKQNEQIAWLFTVLFILNMFTECMFGRFCGIAIWAVGLVTIYLSAPADTDV